MENCIYVTGMIAKVSAIELFIRVVECRVEPADSK